MKIQIVKDLPVELGFMMQSIGVEVKGPGARLLRIFSEVERVEAPAYVSITHEVYVMLPRFDVVLVATRNDGGTLRTPELFRVPFVLVEPMLGTLHDFAARCIEEPELKTTLRNLTNGKS